MNTTPTAYREAILGLRLAATGPVATRSVRHPALKPKKKAPVGEGFRERSSRRIK
jgi:hypothetical protein